MSFREKEFFTKELIESRFIYSKDEGKVYWKEVHHTKLKYLGCEIGHLHRGYREFHIKNKIFFTHRLIFFIEHGFFPLAVDHIDGNKSNNKIGNLRAATIRQNNQNQKRHRDGKLCGAAKSTTSNKWRSIIHLNGKYTELGRFETELEVHNRYVEEVQRMGESLVA